MLTMGLHEGVNAGLRRASRGDLSLLIPAKGTEGIDEAIIAFRPEDVIEAVAVRSVTQGDFAKHAPVGGAIEQNPASGGILNRIGGTLKTVSFMGSVARFELDVASQEITIDRHRPREADIPQKGDRVVFAVPPDSILLFDPKTGLRIGEGAPR